MQITSIQHATKPLNSAIRNAVIDFSEMTTSVVAVISDQMWHGRPVTGFGFCSNGRYSQRGIIEDRLIPRLMKADPQDLLNEEGDNVDPHRCWDIMMKNEKPGGHGERSVAVGTIDMALWDLAAKIEDVPLYKLLADRYGSGPVDPSVYLYAAGGYYYPGKSTWSLRNEVRGYLDSGYESVKIKIGGADLKEDMARVESVLQELESGKNLAVDANGRFDLSAALEYNRELESLDLKWFEEAGDPLDYLLQATLSEHSSIPMATGENLFSATDTRNLLRYAGLNPGTDFLQMDPVLSYGLVEYLRILELLKSHGWSADRCIPHGGHQLTLHIAAAFGLFGNESYPGVFQPFGGFHDSANVEKGYVTLPDAPGIGFEMKNELYTIFKSLL